MIENFILISKTENHYGFIGDFTIDPPLAAI
jgi:hypothetical protein